jgi:hypothetical protein
MDIAGNLLTTPDFWCACVQARPSCWGKLHVLWGRIFSVIEVRLHQAHRQYTARAMLAQSRGLRQTDRWWGTTWWSRRLSGTFSWTFTSCCIFPRIHSGGRLGYHGPNATLFTSARMLERRLSGCGRMIDSLDNTQRWLASRMRSDRPRDVSCNKPLGECPGGSPCLGGARGMVPEVLSYR